MPLLLCQTLPLVVRSGKYLAELHMRIGLLQPTLPSFAQGLVLTSFVTTMLQFLQSIDMSVPLYGAETWTVLDKHHSSLSFPFMNCLRRFCSLSIVDCVPNVDTLSMYMCDTCVQWTSS